MQAEKWRHADDCAIRVNCDEADWCDEHDNECPCSCGLSDFLAATSDGPVAVDRERVLGRLEEYSPGHPIFGGLYRIIPPDDHVLGSSEGE